jgi:Spy/CpxP family protein refolding chaperone
MKKLNLILLAFALMMIVSFILSVSGAFAEDMQATVAPKIEKDKDSDDMIMCPIMKAQMGGGMGMMKMDMGQGMMCPMMEKMKGDMPMAHTPMMGIDVMAYADKLQLTQDQRDKIDVIIVTQKKDMIKKNADREIAQVDLNELIKKDDPDLMAINDQLKKIASMEADIKFAQIKVGVDTKSVLTKEQKDSLKMIMEHERATGMPMGKTEPKDMPLHKPGEPATKPMPEKHEM